MRYGVPKSACVHCERCVIVTPDDEFVTGYTCDIDEHDMKDACTRNGCNYYRRQGKAKPRRNLVRFSAEGGVE